MTLVAGWPGLDPALLGEAERAAPPVLARVFEGRGLEPPGHDVVRGLYASLSAWIASRAAQKAGLFVLGISGGQGAGKSTLAETLFALLAEAHGLRAIALSIDDLYLTRSEREALARTVHPLLAVRGQPGTHDVDLGLALLDRLRRGERVAIPRFDKANDDRFPEERWSVVEGRVDVLLFEGWCVGLGPEPFEALAAPVNDFEATEDPSGAFRAYVRRQLAGPYARLFAALDALVYLEVPDMERVLAWRLEQEHTLARERAGAFVMSDAEVARFVQRFERLTRHGLATLPERADVVVTFGDDHRPRRVRARPS